MKIENCWMNQRRFCSEKTDWLNARYFIEMRYFLLTKKAVFWSDSVLFATVDQGQTDGPGTWKFVAHLSSSLIQVKKINKDKGKTHPASCKNLSHFFLTFYFQPKKNYFR